MHEVQFLEIRAQPSKHARQWQPQSGLMTPYNSSTVTQTVHQAQESRPVLNRHLTPSDPSRLAPEDAFTNSPPRKEWRQSPSATEQGNGSVSVARVTSDARRKREKARDRSGSRRRKGTWKKLLWVKQSCG